MKEEIQETGNASFEVSEPNGFLLAAAIDLAKAMNKIADKSLPKRLASIVKLHSGVAAGTMFVPVPGLDLAVATGNIWTMYVRINKEIGLPFSQNLIKSIAGGIATNLGSFYAVTFIVGSIFKLFPGIGTVAGTAVVVASIYTVTVAAGIIYMKVMAKLFTNNDIQNINEEDLRKATEEFLQDRKTVTAILQESKDSYKKQ